MQGQWGGTKTTWISCPSMPSKTKFCMLGTLRHIQRFWTCIGCLMPDFIFLRGGGEGVAKPWASQKYWGLWVPLLFLSHECMLWRPGAGACDIIIWNQVQALHIFFGPQAKYSSQRSNHWWCRICHASNTNRMTSMRRWGPRHWWSRICHASSTNMMSTNFRRWGPKHWWSRHWWSRMTHASSTNRMSSMRRGHWWSRICHASSTNRRTWSPRHWWCRITHASSTNSILANQAEQPRGPPSQFLSRGPINMGVLSTQNRTTNIKMSCWNN